MGVFPSWTGGGIMAAPPSNRSRRASSIRVALAYLLFFCMPATDGLALAAPRLTAFLTREPGKNGILRAALESLNVATEELPCINFKRTEGYSHLCATLSNCGDEWDSRGLLPKLHPWVVITSPTAAIFFAEAWAESRDPSAPKPNIACVGAGSAKALEAAGLTVDFLPSKADGKTLAAELPADASAGSVLFPASALAADTIKEGLASRGIRVRRINTYDTVPAEWAPADLARAQAARLVTFGSPSAVRVWAERVGTSATAACIGETTAEEARKCGFGRVVAPERPGVEAWAACCVEAMEEEQGSLRS